MSAQMVSPPEMAAYNNAILSALNSTGQGLSQMMQSGQPDTSVQYIPPASEKREVSAQALLMEVYSKTRKYADWQARVQQSFSAWAKPYVGMLATNEQLMASKQSEFFQTPPGQMYVNENNRNVEEFSREVIEFYIASHLEKPAQGSSIQETSI